MANGEESNGNVKDLTAQMVNNRRQRHEKDGSTISVYLPPEADWGLREELLNRVHEALEEVFCDRDDWDPIVVGHMGDVLYVCQDGHVYLSTSCLHDEHDYCQSNMGLAGLKTPASCKFCKAKCICPCHAKTPDREGLAKTEEGNEDEDEAVPQPAPAPLDGMAPAKAA